MSFLVNFFAILLSVIDKLGPYHNLDMTQIHGPLTLFPVYQA